MKEIQYFSDGEQATAAVLNRPLKDLNKQGQYISKAQFEANADINRKAYAGSGFINMGSYYTYQDNINDGMYIELNAIHMGRSPYYPPLTYGDSDTWYPELNVEGYRIRLGRTLVSLAKAMKFELPEAPTSLGTITDSTSLGFNMKQGDFAILNDTTRELIKNGNFDSNVDNWYVNVSDRGDIEFEDGRLKLTATGTGSPGIAQTIDFVLGTKYSLDFTIELPANSKCYMNTTGGRMVIYESGTYSHEFYDNNTRGNIEFYLGGEAASDGAITYLDNVSIKQVEEAFVVANYDMLEGDDIYENISKITSRDSISRQDLIFIETWHENVADKDIVYPLGNVQNADIYSAEGIANIAEGTFEGYDTYSLFGDWQEAGDLVGLGYKWSELSNEDKLKFAGNKDNNIYKDGDNIIQVRYRIRVVKGVGNRYSGVDITTASELYKPNNIRAGGGVQASNTKIIDSRVYVGFGHSHYKGEYIGVGVAEDITKYLSYDNRPMSIPIALVQRRNDGAFDPVYNPEGSGTFTDGKEWFETADSHNNLTDCFNNKANGYIGTVSGRPDGLFVDEVNERDVEDLRFSVKNKSNRELLEEYNNKAINAKLRGKEKTQKIRKVQFWLSSNADVSLKDGGVFIWREDEKYRYYLNSNIAEFKYYTNKALKGNLYNNHFRKMIVDYTDENGVIAETDTVTEYAYGDQLRNRKVYPGFKIFSNTSDFIQNNNISHCNIIGTPNNIDIRTKIITITGDDKTAIIRKNTYVKANDNYYRSLVDRGDEAIVIDPDTEDYTNTSNWLDLGTDGSIGGYPQTWFDRGFYGEPLVNDDKDIFNLFDKYIDPTYGDIYIKFQRKYSSIQKVIVSKKDGSMIEFPKVAVDNTSRPAALSYLTDGGKVIINSITVNINDSYADMGYNSAQEMLDLCYILVYFDTKSDYLGYTSSRGVAEIGTVEAKDYCNYDQGSVLVEKLIDTASTGGYNNRVRQNPESLNIDVRGNAFYATDYNQGSIKNHSSLLTDFRNYGRSSMVKFFDYMNEDLKYKRLIYNFKEIRYMDIALSEDNTFYFDDTNYVLDNGSNIDFDFYSLIGTSRNNFDTLVWVNGANFNPSLGIYLKGTSETEDFYYLGNINDFMVVDGGGGAFVLRIPGGRNITLHESEYILRFQSDSNESLQIDKFAIVDIKTNNPTSYNTMVYGDDGHFRNDTCTGTADDNGMTVLSGHKAIRLPYFSNK